MVNNEMPSRNGDLPPLFVALSLLALLGKPRQTRLNWRKIAIPIRHFLY